MKTLDPIPPASMRRWPLLGLATLLLVFAAVLVIALASRPLGPEAAQAQNSTPTVTAVAITSNAGSDNTYAKDDVIRVTLTFSEAVNVTGTPQVAIDMDPADWGQKWAGYLSGSGTTDLLFSHTVVEPNLSTQGIAVIANSLRLNSGTITAASGGANANLAHSGLAHNASHKVDWRLPAATVDCTTTLTVAVISLREVQGTWTIASDNAFCDAGGWFVDFRESGNGWGAGPRASSGGKQEFRHGGLTRGRTYEFRVRLVDERGKGVDDSNLDDSWITTSNTVSKRIGGGIPGSTVKLAAPGTVSVYWALVPEEDVTSINHYLVRHRKVGTSTWTTSADLTFTDTPLPIAYALGEDIPVHELTISGLEEASYQFQAGANVTIGDNTSTAWAEVHTRAVPVDPFRVWFIDNTPQYNHTIGRVFMMVNTNYNNASATCDINGGSINCPPRTLVSLDVHSGGKYNLMALATLGSLKSTTGSRIPFVVDGKAIVQHMGASGGRDNIVVSWAEADSQWTDVTYTKDLDPSPDAEDIRTYKTKELDSYIVQYRQGHHAGDDSEDSVDWTEIRKPATARHHELSGLPPGIYQVRVQPCMAVVEIVNNAESGNLQRCLQRKESTVSVVVNPEWTENKVLISYEDDPGIVRGSPSSLITVSVDSENAGLPTVPRYASAGAGVSSRTISVNWRLSESDGGAIISDYQIRYRQQGTSSWSYAYGHPIHDIPCRWSLNFGCHNTGLKLITGLTSGAQYELGIRARNANGHSEWVDLGTAQAK